MVTLGCTEKMQFDLQGHRGARGLMPENTIPAFLHALELGVTTLELDVVVSADSEVVVSHEPFISGEICLDREGKFIPEEEAYSHNLYEMTYEQIKTYECGMLPHPRFLQQEKISTIKPRLIDVFQAVEQSGMGEKVCYNIELKSQKHTDGIYHPDPKIFSDLVYNTIDDVIDWKRVTIQSFDLRVLQYFHQAYPHIRLALLIENKQSVSENLDSLGFAPDIYSPYFELLSQEIVKNLHNQGIEVIPWTVNEHADMRRVRSWGVDGLITDYPDRYRDLD